MIVLSLISSLCLFIFSVCILPPHTFTHTHTNAHTHTCTHTLTHAHTHIRTHTFTHAHTPSHMHMHTHATHTSPFPHSVLQRICPPSPRDPGPLPGGVVSLDGKGLCFQHEAVDGAVPLPPQQCPGLHQHLSTQPHTGRGGCQWTGTDSCTVTEMNQLHITMHVHIWPHTSRASHSCERFCAVSLLDCVEPTIPADGCGSPWCGWAWHSLVWVWVALLGVGGRGTACNPRISSSACALIVHLEYWVGSSLHACVLLLASGI